MSDLEGTYVRRPDHVQAVRLELAKLPEIVQWCKGIQTVTTHIARETIVSIKVKDGMFIAALGDWIVLDTDGKYYHYTANRFKECFLPLSATLDDGDLVYFPPYDR